MGEGSVDGDGDGDKSGGGAWAAWRHGGSYPDDGN
jgi:hypothetical protein